MFDLRIELKKVALKVQEILETIKNIKEALYDSGWIELNNEVSYRKKNGIVYVTGESAGSKGLSAGAYTEIGALPVGYRPNQTINGIAVDAYGGSQLFTGYIGSGGGIMIYAVSHTNYWRMSASFPVGGGYFLTLLRRLLRGGACYA